MSSLQVCLEGSKAEGEVGAMLPCLSNAKQPNIRHTCMKRPSGHRVDVRRHRQCRREGRICSHLRGLVLMEMSAALRREWTWNESRAVGDSPSSLWGTRMPEA